MIPVFRNRKGVRSAVKVPMALSVTKFCNPPPRKNSGRLLYWIFLTRVPPMGGSIPLFTTFKVPPPKIAKKWCRYHLHHFWRSKSGVEWCGHHFTPLFEMVKSGVPQWSRSRQKWVITYFQEKWSIFQLAPNYVRWISGAYCDSSNASTIVKRSFWAILTPKIWEYTRFPPKIELNTGFSVFKMTILSKK